MEQQHKQKQESNNSPHFLIIGAGILGSQFAAYFHEQGLNVSLLARGQKAEKYKEHGIRIRKHGEEEIKTYHVPIITKFGPEERFDIIFVLMQKHQAKELVPLLSQNKNYKLVAFLGNNIIGFSDYLGKNHEKLDISKILLGFGLAAGFWEGDVIRGLFSPERCLLLGPTINGSKSHVDYLTSILDPVGFTLDYCPDSEAWLQAHGALILPLAFGGYASGLDRLKIAQDTALIDEIIKATKEGLKVVKKVGKKIYPKKFKLFSYLPTKLLRKKYKSIFESDIADTALIGHARAAREEMKGLAVEFDHLIELSKVKTPYWDKLKKKS